MLKKLLAIPFLFLFAGALVGCGLTDEAQNDEIINEDVHDEGTNNLNEGTNNGTGTNNNTVGDDEVLDTEDGMGGTDNTTGGTTNGTTGGTTGTGTDGTTDMNRADEEE
ncbi:hypothetical protein C1N55_01015 [Lysinibacillus sp. SGAir0095]|nr:hypothetical protein C1N55_01015 [Lysinibacillus sp. SGAir0095]